MSLRSITAAISAVLLAHALHAQAPLADVTWKNAQQEHFYGKAEVLLTADPTSHHVCNVKAVEPDRIVCTRHLRSNIVYRRADIQEIIVRGYSSPVWPAILIGGIGIGGGIVTGAVFLAMLGPWGIAAAVPIAAFGAFFGYFCSVFDDGRSARATPHRLSSARHRARGGCSMIRPRNLPLFVATTALCGAVTSRAQAPIERRPPSNSPTASLPQAPSALRWPEAFNAAPGTTVLVETSDANFPHICRLDHINPDDIVCEGGRAPGDVAYERAFIESIQFAPRGYAALSGAKKAAFAAGGVAVLLGGACNVDGGGVCPTPVYTGLGLLATGVVLHFVQYHLKHKDPRMLYVATGPVARPVPRLFGMPFPQPYP